MAEWLIAPVLKTGIVRNKELSRVRIPLSPLYSVNKFVAFLYFIGFARLSSIKGIGSIIRKWLGYPERFEENSIGLVGQEFELLPFGGGRRVCPGLAFAVASAEYVLANLLFWFDWKLPRDGSKLAETLNMTEVFGLTVHKKTPLYLIPTPYTP